MYNLNTPKRGQITIFIIVGIIIVILIGFLFYIKGYNITDLKSEEQKTIVIPPQIVPIKDFINSCIKSNGADGIYLISMQGGFLNPEPYVSIKTFKVGFLYSDQESKLPSLQDIERDISGYVKFKLNDCINDFKSLKEKGFDIKTDTIKINTIINEDSVEIIVDFPVTVEKSGVTISLPREYNQIFPIRLKKYYDVANNIVKKEIEDSSRIDAIFLLDQNISVDFTNYGNNIIVYALRDDESIIGDKQYLFVFANEIIKDEK